MKSEFLDSDRELAVVITITNWDEAPRFRHEITKCLTKRYNVLYLQVYSQRGYRRKSCSVNKHLIVDKLGFSFFGISRLFNRFPNFKKVYNWYLLKKLRGKIRKHGYDRALAFNFQYNFSELNRAKFFSKIVYVCNDDFINVGTTKYRRLRAKWESEVVSCADLIITTSEPLKDAFLSRHKNVHVIYSGHDFNDFTSRYRQRSCTVEKISLCYLGFLNGGTALDWLEYVLSFNNYYLTIIGPNAKSFLSKASLENDRLRHIKYLEGEDLYKELTKHDVFLMVYSSDIDNNLTSVPAKLFQYLSVGKPVVSSIMPRLINLPDGFVYQAQDRVHFLDLINKSVSEDGEKLFDERIKFSKGHTWDERGKHLFSILDKLPYRSLG